MTPFPPELEALMPEPAVRCGDYAGPPGEGASEDYFTADQVRQAMLDATERAAKKERDACMVRIATLSGQRYVLLALLRECLGPLEVSAAIFESDDAEPLEELIRKVSEVLSAFDAAAIRGGGQGS